MIVQAPCMRQLLAEAERLARSKASILIEGESGTGKELIARHIHSASPRRGKPFVGVNCTALSETLVESELFGHERGAFTGAEEKRAGRFERAQGGTLLLDEISDMPLKMQAKLLRVLEEEEFERVGGTEVVEADVRILATTNRALEEEIERDGFRRDLYYRLTAATLHLPPLRARREEIAPLAEHFFTRFRADAAVPLQGFSGRALALLQDYRWPGNIRQLRNVIQRACLVTRGPEIKPEDLALGESSTPPVLPLPAQTLDQMERQMIWQALRDLNGNKTAAARRLGITLRTLHNKLTRYRREEAA